MDVFFKRSDAYFRNNITTIIEKNWALLRYMTLLYAGGILIYFLTAGLYAKNKEQDIVVLTALAAQLVYSACVWSRKRAPKSSLVMSLWLWIFGCMIMTLAIALGDFVFTANNAWLFLIMLILLTQIYSIPPYQMFIALPAYVALFLFFSNLNKGAHLFYIDTISSISALVVAFIAYVTILGYRISDAETKTELARMSSIDAMTGMYNKNTFIYLYHNYMKEMTTSGEYALAVIDMDRFKEVNDQNGHLVGDEVLVTFASALTRHFPDTETSVTGRFGGDEFVVFIKNTGTVAETLALFRRLMTDFSSAVKTSLGFDVTCSVGVALDTRTDLPFSRLFLAADQKLYQAKKISGNSIELVSGEETLDGRELLLAINTRESDLDEIKRTFRDSYNILETRGTRDTINTLERYGECLSMVIADIDDSDERSAANILPEITKISGIHSFPIVIITDSDSPSAWDALASARVIRQAPAAELTEAIGRLLNSESE